MRSWLTHSTPCKATRRYFNNFLQQCKLADTPLAPQWGRQTQHFGITPLSAAPKRQRGHFPASHNISCLSSREERRTRDYCKGTFSSSCAAVNLFWQAVNTAASTIAFQFTSDLSQYNFFFSLPTVRDYFYPNQQAYPNDSTHPSQQTERKLVPN